MILRGTLLETVKAQKENLLNSDLGIEREKLKDVKLTAGFASIITGIRRAGKSTLLIQLIQKITAFRYLNFEDVRIFGFDHKDFIRLDDVFSAEGNSNYYLFDEIQVVAGWERYVRSLLDKKKIVVLTGSNAAILGKELGITLTGRHLKYELMPFSYPEFLKLTKQRMSYTSFEDFVNRGGFPEYLKINNEQILQELFNDIIIRDITLRYNLRNPKLVKELALYLLSNVGKEFSYQGLKKLFNLGSVNTIISIVGYFENSYLLFTIPQFDFSYRKQVANKKKVYSVDTGLIKANSVSFSQDKGRMLENIVFTQLKRMGLEVFYFKKERECDFITRNSKKELNAYQVCFELNEDNKDREINGLIEALNYLKQKVGFILTLDQHDELELNGKKIIVKPVYTWMKEQI
jgi:predicted AAA+ superfamily ATPase